MLILVIVFGVLAAAFGIELWSIETRLMNAEIVLAKHGLLPEYKHSARTTQRG